MHIGIDLGNIEPIYERCGPTPPIPMVWYTESGEYIPPPKPDPNWELQGPRCSECAEKMRLTGENHYCGKPVVVATVRSEPATSYVYYEEAEEITEEKWEKLRKLAEERGYEFKLKKLEPGDGPID